MDFEFLGMGFNTLMLQLHRLSMIFALILGAFLFASIFFNKQADDRLVSRLKWTSAIAFVLLLLTMLTGILPDLNFASGAAFSGTFTGTGLYDFGTTTRQISDAQLGNLTGPLLFDMMEHVALMVPGLAALAGFLIFYYGGRAVTNKTVKFSILSIMSVTAIWVLTIGGIGGYLVAVLTFPVNQ
jgi:hypothetical protein